MLTVICILVILGIIGITAIGIKSSDQTADTNSNSGGMLSLTTPTVLTKLDQPADDGKLQFTITEFACGKTQVTQPDNSYVSSQAEGQFCVTNLTVKNISNVSQSFDISNQYIYDASNKQYSYSLVASIDANPSDSQFPGLEDVNPGITVSGIIIFDIPKNITPVYAILRDYEASNGVRVNLQ